jgi:phosphoserine/homoserine phosphotransferase
MAAGDSFNDTGMLLAADAGFFIHAPPAIAAQFPQFPVTNSYAELTAAVNGSAASAAAGGP